VTSVINGKKKLGNVTKITKTTNEHGTVSLSYYVLWNTYKCSIPYQKSELVHLRDPKHFPSIDQPEQTNSQYESVKTARKDELKLALIKHSDSLLLLRQQDTFYKNIVSISELGVKKQAETKILSQRKQNNVLCPDKLWHNPVSPDKDINKLVEEFDKTVCVSSVVYKRYETDKAPIYSDFRICSPLKICMNN
jgi:hypothetical protein